MKKKIFLVIGFLAVFGLAFSFSPLAVKAQSPTPTVEELRAQIADLLVKITQLQQLLAQRLGQVGQVEEKPPQVAEKPTNWCYDFNGNIKDKDTSNDVSALQSVLEKEGLKSSQEGVERSTGVASGKRPTGYFDENTREAVKDFQKKYKKEISDNAGYEISATGFVGKGTRDQLNKLYGCKGGGETPPTPITPVIQVLSPNGGEKWVNNTTQIIQWNSSSDVKTVRILLWAAMKAEDLQYPKSTALRSFVISEKEPASRGYMRWTIDANALGIDFSRDKYFSIGIEGYNISPSEWPATGWGKYLIITDTSDNYFSVIDTRKKSPCGSYGDVNGDGYVTSVDSSLVSDIWSGKRTPTSAETSRADVNGNGQVDTQDVLAIADYVNGKSTTFAICQTQTR